MAGYRLGYYGAAFDPPHIEHQRAIMQVLSTGMVHRLIVAPTYKHPLGKEMLPFVDRMAMCDRLTHLFNDFMFVSIMEKQVYEKEGNCNTLTMVKHLLKINNADVTGTVVVLIYDEWHRERLKEREGYAELKELEELGKVEFCFVDRHRKYTSAHIRTLIWEKPQEARRYLPRFVFEYIKYNRLYDV